MAFISLMQGGGDDAIIQRWLTLAEAEADPSRKSDLALVLVFAEAVNRVPSWKKALEKWNMKESTIVASWKAEAKREGNADFLLRVAKSRFGTIDADTEAAIRSGGLDDLSRWLDIALSADTLDRFRQDAGL